MMETSHSVRGYSWDDGEVFDFIGVGFGPSNLALAVAARELDPNWRGIFFESKPEFQWHPGMLLGGSRMQISFLKDLATLRNPASPYTFLQYTKAKGRLERFVNLKEFHPTRIEYQDYMRWVAEVFAGQVRYGTAVRRVTPVAPGGAGRPRLFRVEAQDVRTRESSVRYARNVVYACGGKPRVPEGRVTLTRRIIHSGDFLHSFPGYFTDHERGHEFAVVGDGQSAGEIAAELLQLYPRARVHLFVSGFAPRPVDNSPFVNEAFFSTEADAFYRAGEAKRKALSKELRNTNYGVIDLEVINDLYRRAYLDEVKGERRLYVHRFSELVSAEDTGDGVSLVTRQRCCDNERLTLRCDGLVLATGYRRGLDEEMFADVLPFIERGESDDPLLSRNYRVRTTHAMECGLYVQGFGESSHGIGDTLLSLLPFRSQEIFDDMRAHAPRAGENPAAACASNGRPAAHAENGNGRLPTARLTEGVEYPPRRHLEDDSEKLYAIIERFKFATIISVQPDGEPVVTHVPLTLDRSRGGKGVLFGHMDRANPHVELLEGCRTLVVFHGPNAYISPHVYETDQLPTWNSISVHVRGRTRLLRDRAALVRGLVGICEQEDRRPGAYRLSPDDRRIGQLINYIIGFELEIDEMVGRFKLSQDRGERDRRLAAAELTRRTEAGARALIELVTGSSLEEARLF